MYLLFTKIVHYIYLIMIFLQSRKIKVKSGKISPHNEKHGRYALTSFLEIFIQFNLGKREKDLGKQIVAVANHHWATTCFKLASNAKGNRFFIPKAIEFRKTNLLVFK